MYRAIRRITFQETVSHIVHEFGLTEFSRMSPRPEVFYRDWSATSEDTVLTYSRPDGSAILALKRPNRGYRTPDYCDRLTLLTEHLDCSLLFDARGIIRAEINQFDNPGYGKGNRDINLLARVNMRVDGAITDAIRLNLGFRYRANMLGSLYHSLPDRQRATLTNYSTLFALTGYQIRREIWYFNYQHAEFMARYHDGIASMDVETSKTAENSVYPLYIRHSTPEQYAKFWRNMRESSATIADKYRDRMAELRSAHPNADVTRDKTIAELLIPGINLQTVRGMRHACRLLRTQHTSEYGYTLLTDTGVYP